MVSTSENSLPHLLIRLWQHLSLRRKRQVALVLGLMLVSGFAEVVSLGAVLPFLGILTAPEQVFKYPAVASAAEALGVVSADQMVLPLTIAFIVAALMAGIIRLLLLWVSIRLSNASGADLSIAVYRRTLYQPYSVHVARNSSLVISGIGKIAIVQSVLQCLLGLVSAVVLVVFIMFALLSINAKVAISAALGFGVCYALIVKLTRWRLDRNSQRIAHEANQMIKTLQEGLGGIRDVLLDGTQAIYCDVYRGSILTSVRANGQSQFMGTSPRYIMEAIGMVLIAILAYNLSRGADGIAGAMPVLGALALGAQRMLPAIQQFYGGWASIAGSKASLADALELLDQPMPLNADKREAGPLVIKHAIQLDDVSFRYFDDGPLVLESLNLTIPRGARVGFVGSTGGGKSTILDLLMGLLDPSEGTILVDGLPIRGEHRSAWQKSIAHVPQSIYLADSSIAENIAFGVASDAIDNERLREAASQAQISGFIESLPDGYRSFVGERGVRLSGGQRQRIGIARALYKRASVLVFDEATSALDNATEQAVVDSISKLNRELTVLLVAHRLSSVRKCDLLVELQQGRVVAKGTYEELLDSSPSFRSMAKVVG